MPSTPPWLTSLLQEHFEELQMLWELRGSALRDRDYHARDLAELDERIEAHVDGLVLAEADAHPILVAGLAGGASVVFAAAYCLLCGGSSAGLTSVLDQFLVAEGEALLGFRDAFCHGPWKRLAEPLRNWARTGPPHLAAIATEVLAFHGELAVEPAAAAPWLNHDEPIVRGAAWRAIAYSGK